MGVFSWPTTWPNTKSKIWVGRIFLLLRDWGGFINRMLRLGWDREWDRLSGQQSEADWWWVIIRFPDNPYNISNAFVNEPLCINPSPSGEARFPLCWVSAVSSPPKGWTTGAPGLSLRTHHFLSWRIACAMRRWLDRGAVWWMPRRCGADHGPGQQTTDILDLIFE